MNALQPVSHRLLKTQSGFLPHAWIFALTLGAGIFLAALITQPGYTDAYYYFNAAHRLVTGTGLTDPYLWQYLNPPDHLPAPAHSYWMPLQSLLAAAAMKLFGPSFGAAQVPSVLCFAGLVTVTFLLGGFLGDSRRHARVAALLVLFSGFYVPVWTTTDTFAVYGLAGSLSLAAAGLGRERRSPWRFLIAGALAGVGHLARADGLLLILIAAIAALLPGERVPWRSRTAWILVALLGYLLVMSPWFARNLSELGTPFPAAGAAGIWLRGYEELVHYPAQPSFRAFVEWGMDNILASRWLALRNNLATFVAAETWVILSPFVLVGLWQLRRRALIQVVIVYAIALHLVMTLVFAYPGYRGGLFHSASALLPYWAVTGVLGLDRAIEAAARWRGWSLGQAQRVFSTALVVLAATLSLYVLLARVPALNNNAVFYRTLAADLPSDARLIANDPAALYYHTGLGGVVLPDAPPERVLDLSARYGVDFLVLDENRTEAFAALYRDEVTYPFLRLHRVYSHPQHGTEVQVYAIVHPEGRVP